MGPSTEPLNDKRRQSLGRLFAVVLPVWTWPRFWQDFFPPGYEQSCSSREKQTNCQWCSTLVSVCTQGYTRRELNLSYLLIYDKQLNNYVKIT